MTWPTMCKRHKNSGSKPCCLSRVWSLQTIFKTGSLFLYQQPDPFLAGGVALGFEVVECFLPGAVRLVRNPVELVVGAMLAVNNFGMEALVGQFLLVFFGIGVFLKASGNQKIFVRFHRLGINHFFLHRGALHGILRFSNHLSFWCRWRRRRGLLFFFTGCA